MISLPQSASSERTCWRIGYALSLVGMACALLFLDRHIGLDANRLYWEYAGRLLHAPVTKGYIEWIQHRVGTLPSPASAAFAARHLAPYTDFPCEYPPGSLLLFAAIRYFYDDLSHFSRAFQFSVAILFIAVMAMSLHCARKLAVAESGASRWFLYAALPLVAVSPILIGPFAVSRFDMLPAFFAVGGLALFLEKRPLFAAFMLGLGAATKLWPGIFIPLMAAGYWRSGTRNTHPIAIGALGIAGFLLPHVIMVIDGTNPSDILNYLSYLGDRPPQIESMVANIVVILSYLTKTHVNGGFDFGSQNVYSNISPYVIRIATIANAALLVFAFFVVFRKSTSGKTPGNPALVTIHACGFAICVTMLCSRVFSGEYMMWPLPFILFLFMDKRGIAGAVAFVFSLILLKATYWAYDGLIAAKLSANLVSFSKNAMLAVTAWVYGSKMVGFGAVPTRAEKMLLRRQ